MRALARAALAGLLALAGCQSIAGIEDRHYEPGVQASPECRSYCSDVMSACTDANAAYPSKNDCLRVCATLPPGETQLDNSLECRAQQAALLAGGSGEPASDCPAAGPFGANVCGTTCQGYCTLLKAACNDKLTGISDCEKACSGLREDKLYDLSQLGAGDSVECRVSYAAKAQGDPTACSAAALKSDTCKDPDTVAPSCVDTCRLTMVACTGTNQVYTDDAECQAYCKALDPGKNSDESGNTVGCRKYHSYNSLAAPTPHCAHAGPGGDGHCGGNCDAYCHVMATTCKTEFDTQYQGNAATCQSECAKLQGSANDSFAKTPKAGNTLTCRLINLAKATVDPARCLDASGDGDCK